MSDYFLHHDCGYTYDADGVVDNITPQEEARLWTGKGVYDERFDPMVGEGDGEGKPGRSVSKAEQQEFEKFAAEVNEKRN